MSKRTQKRQQPSLKGHPDAQSHDEPPLPYTVASSDLQPFLSTLDQSLAYILHVDSLPWQSKRRIFTVPVLLNITIAALLCWRAYAIIPTYLRMLLSMIGYTTSATVDVPSKTTYQLVQITLVRTLSFLFDFILFRFIAPWPWTFFLERPGNPVLWRWRVGFRDREIIIRVSRRWGCEELLKGETKGDKNPFFKVRVLPAIDKNYIRGKTGYLMMSKYWDLDFAAMVRATQLVDDGTMTLEHFEKTVLVWDEGLGWLAWPVHKIERQGAGEDVGKQLSAFKVC